jgi:23S rRNA pseudouridine1911/1915/1917 synthase
MSENNEISICVDLDDSGQRVDALVASRISTCSRSCAAELIRKGIIQVGNQVKKPGYRLKPGDVIQGHIPPPRPVTFEAEAIPLTVLYEDTDIIAINKPSGMVVHPAPGHGTGTLVNALLYHCPDLEGIGGELRPGIVHRLDKDTTGVLVVAKNGPALAELARQFKFRTLRKKYLALVHGKVKTDSGVISLSIGRHPKDRKKMAVLSTGGKQAETRWSLRQRLPETSLLEVDLKTGRTHQIRVHLAAVHHPLIGDPVYSGGRASRQIFPAARMILSRPTRQMLHAWRIEIQHPGTGKPLILEAPLPPDMEGVINDLTALEEKSEIGPSSS